MSVVEAMQLGLVPVVTPAGEIANYCRNGENSIFIEDETQALEDIKVILGASVKYRSMRENAIATWRGSPLYAESFIAAAKELVA